MIVVTTVVSIEDIQLALPLSLLILVYVAILIVRV